MEVLQVVHLQVLREEAHDLVEEPLVVVLWVEQHSFNINYGNNCCPTKPKLG